MKRFILFVFTIVMSTQGFSFMTHASLVNESSQLKALGSVWKTPMASHLPQTKNDITMVYGGADISRRPTLDPRSTTA